MEPNKMTQAQEAEFLGPDWYEDDEGTFTLDAESVQEMRDECEAADEPETQEVECRQALQFCYDENAVYQA
jgi:hypothetical protein